MTTYRFEQYKYPASKTFKCDRCGRPVRRARTFTGTSNPVTTPPYMTFAQMRDHLRPQIDAWLTATGVCTPCAEWLDDTADDGDMRC